MSMTLFDLEQREEADLRSDFTAIAGVVSSSGAEAEEVEYIGFDPEKEGKTYGSAVMTGRKKRKYYRSGGVTIWEYINTNTKKVLWSGISAVQKHDPKLAKEEKKEKKAKGSIKNNNPIPRIIPKQYYIETGRYDGDQQEIQCNCGHFLWVETDTLKNFDGCHHCSTIKEGFGDISAAYLNDVRNNAKKRDLEFNLSAKYLWGLFLIQDGKCALSGERIYFDPDYNKGKSGMYEHKTDQTASLDRIDSSITYLRGNVQWVHKDINNMKTNFSQERFIELCKKVAEYNK